MKTIELQPDEYLGEDGLAYCKNCHTPRVYRYEDNFFHIPCKCRQEAYEKAERERKLKIPFKGNFYGSKLRQIVEKTYR